MTDTDAIAPVRVPASLWAEIKAAAAAQDLRAAQWMRRAFREKLDRDA